MSPTEARAQADALGLDTWPSFLPWLQRRLLFHIVADPRTGSDALLLLGEALRELADSPRAIREEADELRHVAQLVADLAPSRA